MPKRAIITDIECANFGKINGFSRLPMALICPLTSCHSDSALETIESNILSYNEEKDDDDDYEQPR